MKMSLCSTFCAVELGTRRRLALTLLERKRLVLRMKEIACLVHGRWYPGYQYTLHQATTKLPLMMLGRKGSRRRMRAIWSEKVVTIIGNGRLSHQAPLGGWQDLEFVVKDEAWPAHPALLPCRT